MSPIRSVESPSDIHLLHFFILSSLVNYLSLLSYASQTFSHDTSKTSPQQQQKDGSTSPSNDMDDDNKDWIDDFSRLIGILNPTSQHMTSTLTLLSGAVAQASPLPPYLKVPDPYMLSARLEELDQNILNVSHVLEPGYSAFAVMQIASSLVRDDMSDLIG